MPTDSAPTEPAHAEPALSQHARSAFLSKPGAVDGVGADASVPAHYGNPMAEQRALASGEAIVDVSHRAVVSVTGEDRLRWLDSMTSQSLAALAVGESAEALLLSPTGRIEHALKIVDDGVSSWLLVERGEAASLVTWLDSMRFMMRVEVADASESYATVGTFGSSDDLGAAQPNGVRLSWVDPWSHVVAGGHQYAAVPALGADPGSRSDGHPGAGWTWREVIVERARLAELSALPAAGTLALEALRIAAWRPRFATEVDERSIPHELDWLRTAVHLTKGCYRGQETIAKVHNLGHPPRRLAMLHLDGSDGVLPAAGSEVTLGDKVVGRVTSSALHYELGPIALAVLKRTTPSDELTVNADGVTVSAAQDVIVPADAGASLGDVRKQFRDGSSQPR